MDLYFPKDCEGPLPCILTRTPYNKKECLDNPLKKIIPRTFVGQGYVLAVQDKRGRYESEGQYTLGKDDAKDRYGTVEWLTQQSWCDGNIGTLGCSYRGENQIYQAKLRHPNVKAMIPQAAGGATGSLNKRYTRRAFREGGDLNLAVFIPGCLICLIKNLKNLPLTTPRNRLIQKLILRLRFSIFP